jgi:ABC-type multidrug transport system fused ATPase/permease subunit
LLSTFAFYGAYAKMAFAAATGAMTLGTMTLYMVAFRQGQQSFQSMLAALTGMYEDNLYMDNLFSFLAIPHAAPALSPKKTEGGEKGIRFEHVSFRYPGRDEDTLHDLDLFIPEGRSIAIVGKNGAGKTTLIKLLTRLYEPTEGRILLDGLDLREWSPEALHRRIGVIFQDFIRYQLVVGENIGVGDVDALGDEPRWHVAAEMGMAEPFIDRLPGKYKTQLGRWFKDGQELSAGQWQKIALSRAFMRKNADILVLDEPTAAMDAAAEAEVFERFRNMSEHRMKIVISHRFSTVRMADQILVLDGGVVVESGTHVELLAANGRYARLFNLQAEGYR